MHGYIYVDPILAGPRKLGLRLGNRAHKMCPKLSGGEGEEVGKPQDPGEKH